MRIPGFCSGSNTLASRSADGELTMNWYVERTGVRHAPNEAVLLPVPGYRPWGTPAAQVGCRAAAMVLNRFFTVHGDTFTEWSSTGVPTARGTVTNDGNPAQIVGNGMIAGQVLVASGRNAYVFTL